MFKQVQHDEYCDIYCVRGADWTRTFSASFAVLQVIAQNSPAPALGGGRGVSRLQTGYGDTELTDVPQFAKPSRVPPHVPTVSVNAAPVQFGYWM